MCKEFKPHKYQKTIIDYMFDNPRCNIWAGMGMGKTVSTLTALDIRFLSGELQRPALVLAPLRVAVSTWPAEAKKWSHLSDIEVQPIIGTPEQRIKALRNTNANVFTMNYDNLTWLNSVLKHNVFDIVISDESTRLKGFRTVHGGKRTASLNKLSKRRPPKYWVNLTGTPAPNGLKDLWGQQYFIDGGQRLGHSFTAFTDRWFHTVPRGNSGFGELEPLPHAADEIQQRLSDVSISLDAADYFDLQEPITMPVYVDIPARARKHYEELEKEFFTEIEQNEIEALNAASKSIKCLQIANGAVYTEDIKNYVELHDAKIQALESIYNEAAGMPVLVSYHFKHDLARIKKAFPFCRALDDDPQTIIDWNAGKIPMLAAHPASAGHGLNLQDGGNIIVSFAHWWDLELYQQIFERIGPVRQLQAGYNRPVFEYLIIARDTVDEVVISRRGSKKSVQDALLDYMKSKRRH